MLNGGMARGPQSEVSGTRRRIKSMKRSLPYLLTLALAVPALAAAEHGRDQSYFTYDDGGTVLKQGDDARDVEVRVNLPVYPGDDVTTSRRGRSEIRLSDGNVLALDRDT